MKETKNAKTESAKKCLKENYGQLRITVRKEKLEVWKQYAESKGISITALVNQFFEQGIEKDGFIPEKPTSEE